MTLTDNVFPEPVCAMPTMSLPLRAMGQPCAWIAVGSLNPSFLQTGLKNSLAILYHQCLTMKMKII